MQKEEIFEFLGSIDAHLKKTLQARREAQKFELKIVGKSALLLADMKDSIGTKDIDFLKVEGQINPKAKEVSSNLEAEFGISRISVHGYFLQFVSDSIIFLSGNPLWIPIGRDFECLSAFYLEEHHVVASKLFSAFADVPRKKDKQDIRAALDQRLVGLKKVCEIADQVFDRHSLDSRVDRFHDVHAYLTAELMPDYGKVPLRFEPSEDRH